MKQSIESPSTLEKEILELLNKMTLDEKIGQLSLINSIEGNITPAIQQTITKGKIGGVLNEVDVDTVNELQRLATQESRLGIPLLVGRDVIHGFKTIFPIPIGLASSWNPDIVNTCARVSAIEASSSGVNWTFAPMIDISRDPRWGRVAESFGEDPYLSGKLAEAMVNGFQGDDLTKPDSIAACAKHFAGYGASESGKDYNTTNVPENELRNVHLPPFKDALDAGALSIMTSFSDLNGVPASANQFLLKQILRDEWCFDGLVVSDWESISQLSVHGLTANDKESACEAANAGVDMEMASRTYANHLAELIEEGKVGAEQIDAMVSNILKVKFQLGLFDNPFINKKENSTICNNEFLEAAKYAAKQCCVLLENKNKALPLIKDNLKSIAVIGPLADDPYEQLGTWVFDGDTELSQTPIKAIESYVGDEVKVNFVRGIENTRCNNHNGFPDAIETAKKSDVVLLFLGEESILAGEAHCRADISLPGSQQELIEEIAATGKPLILILMTGRPLTLESVVDKVDALLCAWHPGSMAGPAITDLLFGVESPSGKLPITFPRIAGQIPIYYAHKNSGRPGTTETVVHIDDIKLGASQHSFGNTSFHLDVANSPLYPFGFGLSYTEFKYSNLKLSSDKLCIGGSINASVELTNAGNFEAEEVVQLYIRDLVGNVTRPVKELKGFKKIRLKPGETKTITFEITSNSLAFYNRYNQLVVEPGKFHLWIGGCSSTDLKTEFEI